MNYSNIRSHLIKQAVLSSLAGKGISLITQMLVLPMAVSALGVERFGVYAMMMAVFIWANTLPSVVSSALSIRIVEANACSDRVSESRLFSTAFFFTIVIAFLLALVFQLVINSEDLYKIFRLNSSDYNDDLRQAVMVMSILLPINVVATLSESAQSGYQKQYVTNLLMTISNIIVIIDLIWVQSDPSICSLVLAVFVPPLIARIINMLLLWREHPHVLPRWKMADRNTLNSLVKFGAGFALMQIGSFAYLQYPVVLVGRDTGAQNAGYFAAMMQVINISGSFLILFTQPLLPALSDASVRKDFGWIQSAYRLMITRFISYIILATICLGILGTLILSKLLKHSVSIDESTKWLWAFFFFLVAWEHINFVFIAGIGRIWYATSLYLFGAGVMLLFMHILVPQLGLNGVFLSMCLGPVISTVIIYPYLIRRIIFTNSNY